MRKFVLFMKFRIDTSTALIEVMAALLVAPVAEAALTRISRADTTLFVEVSAAETALTWICRLDTNAETVSTRTTSADTFADTELTRTSSVDTALFVEVSAVETVLTWI